MHINIFSAKAGIRFGQTVGLWGGGGGKGGDRAGEKKSSGLSILQSFLVKGVCKFSARVIFWPFVSVSMIIPHDGFLYETDNVRYTHMSDGGGRFWFSEKPKGYSQQITNFRKSVSHRKF